MHNDIEQTRKLKEIGIQTEKFVEAVMAAMEKLPPHIVVGGLMTCLGRVMYVSKLPVETVAQALAGIVEICEVQDTNGSDT